MIGNDVVDLQLARIQSNWKRNGFLQKLFTESEQAMILQHHDPEIMVWILWSMKEAAYKIYNRETGLRAFIPHKLECSIISVENGIYIGEVYCHNIKYFTNSTISDEIIHTIAMPEEFELGKLQFINLTDVLKDNSGLPYYRENNKKIPISVSHHGRAVMAVR